MEHLTWISPAVIIALLLFVWRELRSTERRLEARIDAQGHRLEARVDAQGHRLEARVDAQGDRLEARIDGQGNRLDGRIDSLGERLDEVAVEVRGVSERLARLEGAAFGPWPGRRPDPDPQTAVRAASDD